MSRSTQSVAIVTLLNIAGAVPQIDLFVAHGRRRSQIAVIFSILRDVLLHLRGNARGIGSFQGI